MRWNPAPTVVDLASARDWCERGADWSDGTHATFSVLDATSGRLLGNVSLWEVDLAENQDASIGYRTAPWARGHGVATAARRGGDAVGVRRARRRADRAAARPSTTSRPAGWRRSAGSRRRACCAGRTGPTTAAGTTSTCTPGSPRTDRCGCTSTPTWAATRTTWRRWPTCWRDRTSSSPASPPSTTPAGSGRATSRRCCGWPAARDVPVAAGAERSLTTGQPSGGPPPGPPYWPAVVPPAPGPVDAALDLLAASVSAGAVVVGIGPATTLALLERRSPGRAARQPTWC